MSKSNALHPDDVAVDRFAAAMKEKLAQKRAEGRSGWEDQARCSHTSLVDMLHGYVSRGDPVDVGNLAMMIHQRGERIVSREPASGDSQAGLRVTYKRLSFDELAERHCEGFCHEGGFRGAFHDCLGCDIAVAAAQPTHQQPINDQLNAACHMTAVSWPMTGGQVLRLYKQVMGHLADISRAQADADGQLR